MQGERTIYTVECRDGAWPATIARAAWSTGERYRYRALMPHSEVIFWTVGSKDPSGKFADCTIKDGRNWSLQAEHRRAALDHPADGRGRARCGPRRRDAAVPCRLEVALDARCSAAGAASVDVPPALVVAPPA